MRVFVDENVFVANDSFLLFENYLKKSQHIVFFVDEAIKTNAENLIKMQKEEAGYTILNYLELLKRNFEVRFINTNNYLDTKELSSDFVSDEDESIILVQQKAMVNNLKDFAQNHSIELYKVDGNNLEPWTIKNASEEAFFVDSSDYISEPETLHFDYVFSPNYGYLALSKEPIYEGGEGSVFRTYNNMLVKIYKEKHLTYQNYRKLQRMTGEEIYNPSIVWPLDIVYYRSHFLGYVMEEVTEAENMDDLRDIAFDEYTPKDRVEIALEFLKIIDYLHSRDIVVGDLKFDNILVKSSREIYLIDTGSFQIQDYPCVVYNLEFSEKAYSEEELKKALRTKESEYFAINKIIFEILMLKSPFYKDTNIELDPDKDRTFSFEIEPPEFDKTPPHHIQVWYSLDKRIRENFYYYFKDGKITYVSELINMFTLFFEKIKER